MKALDVGQAVEFKTRAGLSSPWLSGTLAKVEDGVATVTDRRGDSHEVSLRRVREPKDARPPRVSTSLRGAAAPIDPPPTVAPALRPPPVRPSAEAIDRHVAKLGPWRAEAYLDFVRARPCCICGAPAPSDPSHHGPRGVAQKTDDHRAIPLCRGHHSEFHKVGFVDAVYFGGEIVSRRSRAEFRTFVAETIVDLVGEFLKRHTLVPIDFARSA